jgi:hypothetical protein
MNFAAADRTLLGQLADTLIPADGQMPSASQAGVAGLHLDQVLAARPDFAASLRVVLDQARGCDPAAFVERERRANSAAFATLAEFAPSAYFLNDQVRQLIGYSGQTAQPLEERPDYLDEGLLDSVVRRGPIYRPTPPTGTQAQLGTEADATNVTRSGQ